MLDPGDVGHDSFLEPVGHHHVVPLLRHVVDGGGEVPDEVAALDVPAEALVDVAVALSLCTTAHPKHTRLTNMLDIFICVSSMLLISI